MAADEAIKLLWEYVRKHLSEEDQIGYQLIDFLLEQNQFESLLNLGKEFRKSNSLPMALWCEIKHAETQQQWAEMEKLCRKLLEIDPERGYVFNLLINALMNQQRFVEAARELGAKCDKDGASVDPAFLVQHIGLATVVQDWEGVRRSCRKLGIPVNNKKGPIDEDWGNVKIQFGDAPDEPAYTALRTGPATARIIEIVPGEPQRLNDLIAFYPEPIDASEDNNKQENDVPTFRSVGVIIEDGNVGPGWFVNGVFPGEKELKKLADRAGKRGFFLQRVSDNDYSVKDPNSDRKLPGICFLIAAPKDQPPKELNDFLESTCSQWQYPVSWLHLALGCNLPDDLIKSHFEILERYGLADFTIVDRNT
jgi:hypothetical protein